MLTAKIIPNDKGNPPGKLADVELHFVAPTEGPSILADVQAITYGETQHEAKALQHAAHVFAALNGLKLTGFAIWERRGGTGRNVTFPAVNGDLAAHNRLRDLILEAYEAHVRQLEAEKLRS